MIHAIAVTAIPVSDFWGKARRCKPCVCKQKQAQYAAGGRAKIRQYQRSAYDPQKAKERAKKHYWADPEKHREFMRRRRKNDPNVRVREKLAGAVRNGRITKPDTCTQCHQQLPKRQIQAHHVDYTKPLEVLWLCGLCHGKQHRLELENPRQAGEERSDDD